MQVINNIIVMQKLVRSNTGQMQNEYHFWSQNGFYFGAVILPPNGQYMADAKTLNIITKALALRWQLIQPKRTN